MILKRFRVCVYPAIGLALLCLLFFPSSSPSSSSSITDQTTTSAMGWPLPPLPLQQGKQTMHHSVFFIDGQPYRLHPDMLRIDTFTYSSPAVPFHIVHYAWWSHPCETHITSDLNKSAEWNSVDKFRYFEPFIRPGSVVIDIGAHQGDTTVHMAPYAGMTIAFEPNPQTFVATQTNADINRHFNIHVHNAAVWDGVEPRKGEWCYTCNGGADSAGSDPKDCFVVKYVDDLHGWIEGMYGQHAVDAVSFIKIDTEGRDFSILKRLASFFMKKPVNVLVEWFFEHTSDQHRRKMHETIQSFLPRKFGVFDPLSGREIDLLRSERVPDLVLVAQ